MPKQWIKVAHNVEMAHRLLLTPGKCEAIHGHSWWIEMSLAGIPNDRGMLAGLDFGHVKRIFRRQLDLVYDHHTLLNRQDPWAQPLHLMSSELLLLPGLQTMDGDPTTENLSAQIGNWSVHTFYKYGITGVNVDVWETKVNNARWNWDVLRDGNPVATETEA